MSCNVIECYIYLVIVSVIDDSNLVGGVGNPYRCRVWGEGEDSGI